MKFPLLLLSLPSSVVVVDAQHHRGLDGGIDGNMFETNDPCLRIKQGDVPFFMVNSGDDPQEIYFFPLSDIPEGVTLYMTDKDWDGEEFGSGEGVLHTKLNETIPMGRVFGYGGDYVFGLDWIEEGNFHIHDKGDNIFLYCLNHHNGDPHFISAISTWGKMDWWSPKRLYHGQYGEHQTALPDTLLDSVKTLEEVKALESPPELLQRCGAMYLPFHGKYNMYKGPQTGTANLLRMSFTNPDHWERSNQVRFVIDFDMDYSGETNG